MNEVHTPLAMDKKVVFPSSLQWGHTEATGVLEFYIPPFGSSPKKLVRAKLVQGVAMGEKFTMG